MVDEKSEVESKKGISVLVMTLGCVVSVLLGLAGGVLGGPTIKATLGMEVEAVTATSVDDGGGAISEKLEDPSSLFTPMPGVFSPDKERFYADAGGIFGGHKISRSYSLFTIISTACWP